jgi:hypothetical protein
VAAVARRISGCGWGKSTGFCLVEVLIATGLLAFALVALAEVFAMATRANVETRRATSEVILATQKLEEFQSLPFDELVPGETVEYLDASGRVLDDMASGGEPAFIRRSRIEPPPWDPDATAMIRVEVSKYPARSTQGGDVHLATLKTRIGP